VSRLDDGAYLIEGGPPFGSCGSASGYRSTNGVHDAGGSSSSPSALGSVPKPGWTVVDMSGPRIEGQGVARTLEGPAIGTETSGRTPSAVHTTS